MASFVTANGYDPLVYAYLIQEKATELNAIIASGIAATSAFLDKALAGGGSHYELSGYKQLAYAEPNLSDESGSLASLNSIDDSLQKGRVAYLNEAWGVKTFAKDIVGQNPVTAITNGIAGYWKTAIQKRVIASLMGIRDDNITNDDGDMVLDVSNDNNSAVLAGEMISAINMLHTKQTLGDGAELLTNIIMSSVLFTRLQIGQLIATIPNARGEVMFRQFMGYNVIVDDDALLIDTSGTYRDVYTVIFAANSAIGLAEGVCSVPFEKERNSLTGNGGGEDYFVSRMSPVIHIWGFSWTDDTVAGKSASVAELALEDNWDRVWPRKNIGLAFLMVNEALK